MKRCSAAVLAVLLAVPLGARAQGPDLRRWQWFQEVLLPAPKGGPYFAITLPPQVLGKANDSFEMKSGLSDLRLVDGKGELIPHVVRVLRAEYRQSEVPIKQRFDEAPDEKGRFMQVKVELHGGPELKHNEIEVETPGLNYRRHVVVLGSDSADFKDSLKLVDGHVLAYAIEGRLVAIRRLHYTPKSYRFLQVRVYADGDEAPPKVDRITVRHTVAVPGKEVTLEASLEPRQPVRGDGGPGSAWFINLGFDRVPVQQLTFDSDQAGVERPFRLEAAERDGRRLEIFGGEWHWRAAGDKRVLQIDFPEVTASRLRLVVTDFANPPLDLRAVRYSAPAREVVFAQKDYARPVKLYYGNPDAEAPHYDFEREVPLVLPQPSEPAQLGEQVRNPTYEPPPASLSERAPWLIYLALAAASLALLAVLALLARSALARHDAAPAGAGAGEAT